MKRLLIISLLILNANVAYLQNLNIPDSTSEYIYNETYKNIAAFNIKYNAYSSIGLDKRTLLNSNRDFFFDAYIANYGFKFKMEIKELPQVYPLSEYKLYQIFVDGFRYVCENGDIEINKIGVQGFTCSNYYLLALNEKNGAIKFISGQFFRNPIANDFRFDYNAPNSYLTYLKLKTFNLQTKDLVFYKGKGKKLLFKAYSEELKKNITIALALDDLENPQVQVNDK
jgi:hypothetical protein